MTESFMPSLTLSSSKLSVPFRHFFFDVASTQPFLSSSTFSEFQDFVTVSLDLPHDDLIPVIADTLAVLSSLQLSSAWTLILKDPLEPSMCPAPKGTCPNTHSPIPAGLDPAFQTQVSLCPTVTRPLVQPPGYPLSPEFPPAPLLMETWLCPPSTVWRTDVKQQEGRGLCRKQQRQQRWHQLSFQHHEGESKVWAIIEVGAMVKGRETFDRNLSPQTMSSTL